MLDLSLLEIAEPASLITQGKGGKKFEGVHHQLYGECSIQNSPKDIESDKENTNVSGLRLFQNASTTTANANANVEEGDDLSPAAKR